MPVGQAEDLGAFVVGKAGDGCVQNLDIAIAPGESLARIFKLANRRAISTHRHHAGGEHDQIHFELDVVAELAGCHAHNHTN